ncbi:hypothetical protein HOF65_01385 [bacterium]|nr:hypothetical protein [bacterium]MBT3852685.1 hypothetical protein [bacterium]MBT4632833.1 hypothetical protein [bacterium]MBT6779486.1 hypothetical protein [bacterium]
MNVSVYILQEFGSLTRYATSDDTVNLLNHKLSKLPILYHRVLKSYIVSSNSATQFNC